MIRSAVNASGIRVRVSTVIKLWRAGFRLASIADQTDLEFNQVRKLLIAGNVRYFGREWNQLREPQ